VRSALLVGWLALGCASDPAAPGPPFDIEIRVERETLENGLEVVVIPNHTAPAATALVAIRAGSAFEPPELNGYSHLFEHMIFEGSEAVPDSRDFRARLDSLGVSSNGTTSIDRVTYFFTAERAALEPALELFAGALISPALDPAVLEKEKGVVLGEFDLNESDADFRQYRSVRSLLFGDFAGRLDPLGSREAVSAASVEQMRSMHRSHYVPNNAMLVFSGDVTHDDGVALARDYFGDWARAESDPLAAPLPPVPAGLTENRYVVMPADVSITSIAIWWQGPSLDEDREATLAGDLLSSVSFQRDHHFRSLVNSDQAFSAGLSVYVSRRTSYISIELIVPFGRERQTLSSLSTILNTLGNSGTITEQQLDTAKAEYFRSYLFRLDAPSALPHSVANEWALEDSHRYFTLVDELYSVDLGALAHFTQTYMYEKPRAVVLMSSAENIAAQGVDPGWLEGLIE
jgi:zinc protease